MPRCARSARRFAARSPCCAGSAEDAGGAARRGRRPALAALLALLLLGPCLPAPADACGGAGAVLVHPQVRGIYRDAVERIATGLRRQGMNDMVTCALSEFDARAVLPADAPVFALGDAVVAGIARANRPNAVFGLLVSRLGPAAQWGVSLFVEPQAVIERVLALKPEIETLHLVHLAEAPADALFRARAAAGRAGLRWRATAVASVRDAARAIEQLHGADAATAVWFHNGVLGLNPDVLIPPLVRIGWDRRVFVVADDAAYVERGVLMSVAPDLEALGVLAARAATRGAGGLHDAAAVQWGVNRRTAVALGVAAGLRTRAGKGLVPDFVYE